VTGTEVFLGLVEEGLFEIVLIKLQHFEMDDVLLVRQMNPQEPTTLRIHLWLETDEGMVLGIGRAILLMKVEEYGSLKKAASDLGMSYRAAWGKIRKTEKILGTPLMTRSANKHEGYQLNESGRVLVERFMSFFNEVEEIALSKAREAFGWQIKPFDAGVID
jgi:molybdate transport system regulatory protein